jgi:hypothetical protein
MQLRSAITAAALAYERVGCWQPKATQHEHRRKVSCAKIDRRAEVR